MTVLNMFRTELFDAIVRLLQASAVMAVDVSPNTGTATVMLRTAEQASSLLGIASAGGVVVIVDGHVFASAPSTSPTQASSSSTIPIAVIVLVAVVGLLVLVLGMVVRRRRSGFLLRPEDTERIAHSALDTFMSQRGYGPIHFAVAKGDLELLTRSLQASHRSPQYFDIHEFSENTFAEHGFAVGDAPLSLSTDSPAEPSYAAPNAVASSFIPFAAGQYSRTSPGPQVASFAASAAAEPMSLSALQSAGYSVPFARQSMLPPAATIAPPARFLPLPTLSTSVAAPSAPLSASIPTASLAPPPFASHAPGRLPLSMGDMDLPLACTCGVPTVPCFLHSFGSDMNFMNPLFGSDSPLPADDILDPAPAYVGPIALGDDAAADYAMLPGARPQPPFPTAEPVNEQDETGCTPIAWAVCLGNIDALRVLVQNGAIVDLPNSKMQTPLHLACLGDRGAECVDLLLQAGAACNVRDLEASTPIMYATRKGNMHIVRSLLHACADLSFKDARGMTVFMHACSQNAAGLLKLLLDADSTAINDADSTGWTALHWASAVGSVECVRVLLGCKRVRANVSLPNDETALHFAARHGWAEICSLLVRHGAPQIGLALLVKTSHQGLTATEMAERHGRLDCAARLRDLQHELDKKYRAGERSSAAASAPSDDNSTSPSSGTAAEDSLHASGSTSGTSPSHPPSVGGSSLSPLVVLPPVPLGTPPEQARKRVQGSEEDSEQNKQKRREYMRGRRQQERDEISHLEGKVSALEDENTRISQELAMLRAQAARLRDMVLVRSASAV